MAGEDPAAVEKTAARVTDTAAAIIESTTGHIERRAELDSDPRAAELLAEPGISLDTAAAAGTGVAAAGSHRLPGSDPDRHRRGRPQRRRWRKTFRDRLTFPLTDADGRVAGWTARDLTGSSSAPKRLNSPTSQVFDKQTAASAPAPPTPAPSSSPREPSTPSPPPGTTPQPAASPPPAPR